VSGPEQLQSEQHVRKRVTGFIMDSGTGAVKGERVSERPDNEKRGGSINKATAGMRALLS
jgi:hypothetical protein